MSVFLNYDKVSRTRRHRNIMWHVPKVFKQVYRRIERAKMNEATRKQIDLPRIRKSDEYNFW